MFGSEYRPPQGEAARFLVESPICRRLRSRKPWTNADAPTPEESTESDGDGGDDDGMTGNGTPSRAPRDGPRDGPRGGAHGGTRGRATNPGGRSTASHQSGQQQELGPYCSASCLKGMVERGLLDSSCPTVHQHGPGPQHPIDLKKFRQLVRDVLYDRLEYCEELWFRGARGCLYRIRLPDWGYTVVAKGTRQEFIPDLQREAGICNALKSVQGVYTPVYLGSFDLKHPLYYMGWVPIVHMMVLTLGGCPLNHLRTLPDATTAIDGLRAIHGLGVLHRDVAREPALATAPGSPAGCPYWMMGSGDGDGDPLFDRASQHRKTDLKWAARKRVPESNHRRLGIWLFASAVRTFHRPPSRPLYHNITVLRTTIEHKKYGGSLR